MDKEMINRMEKVKKDIERLGIGNASPLNELLSQILDERLKEAKIIK